MKNKRADLIRKIRINKKNTKKILEGSLIKDLITLWTSPTDAPVIKSFPGESYNTSFGKDYMGYFFRNIIISKKG